MLPVEPTSRFGDEGSRVPTHQRLTVGGSLVQDVCSLFTFQSPYCCLRRLRRSTVDGPGDTAVMPPTPDTLSERDRMLASALQWMPYGGGDAEDIMVEFGIPPGRSQTHEAALHDMVVRPGPTWPKSQARSSTAPHSK